MEGQWYSLHEICAPKQWKTISSSELHTTGYPVYGANGIIGYYSQYTHEEETLLVTCRGATCGELNICQPYSYVTGNAMALDKLNKDKVLLKYLYYFLKNRGFSDVISGSAQPQITRTNISKVKVFVPSMDDQEKIVDLFDKIYGLIEQRQAQIIQLDELIQSIFVKMFRRDEKWPVAKLGDVAIKITDGEHNNPPFINGGYPMIMAKNVLDEGVDFTDVSYISKENLEKFRKKCNPERDDLLVVSRGATIGRTSIVQTDEAFALMGSVILVKMEREKLHPMFLKQLLKQPKYKNKLLSSSGFSAQQAIYLKDLKQLEIIMPELDEQNEFASIVQGIEEKKQHFKSSLNEIKALYSSVMHNVFRGKQSVQ